MRKIVVRRTDADPPPHACPTCLRPYLAGEGKASARHPLTSKEAARRPGKKHESMKVLRYLMQHGPRNAGQVTAGLGLKSPNQTATRFMELRETGLIERVPDPDEADGWLRLPTPSGGRGIAHRLTMAGRLFVATTDQTDG